LSLSDAGLFQQAEFSGGSFAKMAGHGDLGESQRCFQVTNTKTPLRQQAHDPQPHLMGGSLQEEGNPLQLHSHIRY
jgi:hypothetical protein